MATNPLQAFVAKKKRLKPVPELVTGPPTRNQRIKWTGQTVAMTAAYGNRLKKRRKPRP